MGLWGVYLTALLFVFAVAFPVVDIKRGRLPCDSLKGLVAGPTHPRPEAVNLIRPEGRDGFKPDQNEGGHRPKDPKWFSTGTVPCRKLPGCSAASFSGRRGRWYGVIRVRHLLRDLQLASPSFL